MGIRDRSSRGNYRRDAAVIAFLAKLPSTNTLVATVVFQVVTTTIAALCGWNPPEGWYTFVLGFAGIGLVQFTVKRKTNGVGENGNGGTT